MAKKATRAAVRAAYDEMLACQAQAKGLYQRIDVLEAQVIAAIGAAPDGTLVLEDGRSLGLRDNFCDAAGRPRNVAFKTAAIRRFEVIAT